MTKTLRHMYTYTYTYMYMYVYIYTCTGLGTINEPTSPAGLDAMQAVQDMFVTQIV